LPEFEQQLVAFPRALADAGKDRDAGVALDGSADQLHDKHGLADPGPAEHCGLAASDQRRQQIDDFDAGVEDLASAALTIERWRRRVNGPVLDVARKRWTPVCRLADCVEQTAEYRRTDRRVDWCVARTSVGAAPKPGSTAERHCSDHSRAEVLLDFGDQRRRQIPFDRHCFINRRQHADWKDNVYKRQCL
jgi:hypothetical protein